MESIYFVLEFKWFVMFRCTSTPLSSEEEVMDKAGSKNRKKQKSVPYIHKVQHKQQ